MKRLSNKQLENCTLQKKMASQKLSICFVAANFLSSRRTLVRRNNRKFARLAYEAFCLAIRNFRFLRDCQKKINQDFYNLHFRNYNEKTFNIDPEPFLSTLTTQLQEGSTVLDVGCGSGRDVLWMKKKGYEITGFERSPNFQQRIWEMFGWGIC